MDRLPDCIRSIVNSCKDQGNVEILLRVTDTDSQTVRSINQLERLGNVRSVIGPRKRGYDSLTEYHDEIVSISTGEWLWQWNDDVMMLTDGWDELLRGLNPDSLYLPEFHKLGLSTYPRDLGCPFVLMHRKHWEPMMGDRPFGLFGAYSDIVAATYAKSVQMPTQFIAGLSVHHLRDTQEKIEFTRK